MKGLLLKEFYNLRMVFVIYLLVVIFLCFIAFSDGNVINEPTQDGSLPSVEEMCRNGIYLLMPLMFIGGFYPGNMLISSYSFDEKSHWTPFILSVGVKKSKVLLSKVLLHLIATFILLIPFLVALFVMDAPFDISIYVGLILTFLASCLFSGSMSLFMCSAIGSSKALVLSSIFSFLTTLIPMGVILIPTVMEGMISYLWIFGIINFFVFGLLMYILFFFLALLMFKKRDF